MIATSDTCEDIPLLRKEIRQLRDEVQKLQKDNDKKDKRIKKLKSTLEKSLPPEAQTLQLGSIQTPARSNSATHAELVPSKSQSPHARRSNPPSPASPSRSLSSPEAETFNTDKRNTPKKELIVPKLNIEQASASSEETSESQVDVKKLLELVRIQQFEIKKLKAQLDISRM